TTVHRLGSPVAFAAHRTPFVFAAAPSTPPAMVVFESMTGWQRPTDRIPSDIPAGFELPPEIWKLSTIHGAASLQSSSATPAPLVPPPAAMMLAARTVVPCASPVM